MLRFEVIPCPVIKFTFLLSILLAACPATAEIYRWTDEAGRVYYGDKPEGMNPEQLRISNSRPVNKTELERIKKRQRLLDVMDEEREERKKNEEEVRLAREKRLTDCDLARKNLNQALTSGYLFEKTDDPLNPKILSEEERMSATTDAENEVKEWCS
jgi:hypothetical protein